MPKSAPCFLASISFGFALLFNPQNASAQMASVELAQSEASPADMEDSAGATTRHEARLQQGAVAVNRFAGDALLSANVLTAGTLMQAAPNRVGSRNMSGFQAAGGSVGSAGFLIGDEPNIAADSASVYRSAFAANHLSPATFLKFIPK